MEFSALPSKVDPLLPKLTDLYKDLHANPELSFAEERTAGRVARQLDELGYDVTTGVGRTGVVGVLRNGAGPTVLLRADFDALPVAEQTGLPYASTATGVDPGGNEVPVMHACGHDMHVTWLLGAAEVLAAGREAWSGTLVLVFQPAEEVGRGAQAMLDDGVLDIAGTPDVAFGQHVGPMLAGELVYSPGIAMAATDSFRVRVFGRGGHGSQPQNTCDPVVLTASMIVRLQTIVSREISATDAAVVTVGSMRAGAKENIIPSEAEFTINVRTFEPAVRTRVLAGIERILAGEAQVAGAPKVPEIIPITRFPTTVNDDAATEALVGAFRAHFGAERVRSSGVFMGSEDFGRFGTAGGFPSVFWFVGGIDPEQYREAERQGRISEDIPSNHSPCFAPVLDPTLATGVRSMLVAALSRLGRSEIR